MAEMKHESPVFEGVESVLLNSPLFKNLTAPEYAATVSFLEARRFPRGTVVYREGETGDELYICLTGILRASFGLSNGARRDLFVIKPGDVFGEIALVTGESQIVTVAAEETSSAAVLRVQDFNRLVSDYPLIAVKILSNISRVQNGRFEESAKYMDDLIRWGDIARRRTIQDELTGLYNRRFLEDSIRDRFLHWEMGLRKMSLMMMDLDKIHAVNEQYGMKAGDQVIIAAAQVIRSVMRSTDICARLSGDEFAILLPDASGKDAFRTAGRLLDAINKCVVSIPVHPESEDYIIFTFHASIGVAEAPANADTGEALKLAADRALHRAKENGRNRVELALTVI
jgi:diguanylate cyclase (GGDEF)-like protein